MVSAYDRFLALTDNPTCGRLSCCDGTLSAQLSQCGGDMVGVARGVLDLPKPRPAIRSIVDDEIGTGIARDPVFVLPARPGSDLDGHRVGINAIADRLPISRGNWGVIHGSKSPSQNA